MKINFKITKLITLGVVLAAVFVVVKVQAASGFPEIMSGSTTMVYNNQTIYGGLGGNYVILNNDSNSNYGFKISLANTFLFRPGCLDQTFAGVSSLCFVLGTGTLGQGNAGSNRLMTSRTTIDGATAYEIPALLFAGGFNINGDVSGDFSYLLKFWNSANLYRGGNSPDGNVWNLGNYAFNPAAQVRLGSDQYTRYSAKLATLAGTGSSPGATIASATNFYLQNAAVTDPTSNSESSKYPEGKVWVVNGNLTLTSVQKFSGVGTIIVNGGNFTLGANAKLLPDPAVPGSRLGIIVLKSTATTGKCTFSGNNKVQAMIFCTNTFTASSNGEFTGSFVASDFAISTSSSVLFTYDPAFDSSQPPGFRNLAMPGTKEVGNQP